MRMASACWAPSGRGSLEAAGLTAAEVPILMCTLGKALGVFGAFVAGSETLIETLIQRGRSYIYTTAMPPALAAAARAALAVQAEEGWRRERVLAHAARFRAAAAELGFELLPSETPIQPIVTGERGCGARRERCAARPGPVGARDPAADRTTRAFALACHVLGRARR